MKSKNYYLLLLVIAAFFVLASCSKEEVVTPSNDDVTLVLEEEGPNLKCADGSYVFRIKKYFLTKRTWKYGEVFHPIAAVKEILAGVFEELKFKFNRNGTYHIVIPAMDRDDTGTWEFIESGSKILFDKGTEGEHFISLISLKPMGLKYTYDDPALGPWELHLKPVWERRFH